jgi:hypothetical protein
MAFLIPETRFTYKAIERLELLLFSLSHRGDASGVWVVVESERYGQVMESDYSVVDATASKCEDLRTLQAIPGGGGGRRRKEKVRATIWRAKRGETCLETIPKKKVKQKEK